MAKFITKNIRTATLLLAAVAFFFQPVGAQEIVSSSNETQTNIKYRRTVVKNLQQEVARRQTV
ncbi:MAG: hypothetical protein J6T33_03425, partial [Bacteroidales bacterium]|nr:hypothetical protein [Bacteroidales bacterium]